MKPAARKPILFCFFLIVLAACGSTPPSSPNDQQAERGGRVSGPTSGDIDEARRTLILFFEALSRRDYRAAAQFHWSPNPLQLLNKDVEPGDGAGMLERACESDPGAGCSFHCWRIRDVLGQTILSDHSFAFMVRFEDGEGYLLRGGNNVTPGVCTTPDCQRTEFSYTVRKEGDAYYVEGVPVFSGCWP